MFLSSLVVADAISEMGREEVLEAKIVLAGAIPSYSLKYRIVFSYDPALLIKYLCKLMCSRVANKNSFIPLNNAI